MRGLAWYQNENDAPSRHMPAEPLLPTTRLDPNDACDPWAPGNPVYFEEKK